MKVSVIIPLYNKENTIRETVASVLNQKHKDFELLIINDGSTDSSLKIVSEIEDERISIFSKPNGGVSEARNFGIKKAQYDYIFFLDADDIIYPNCLWEYARLVRKYPETSVFTSNFKISPGTTKDLIHCQGIKEQLITNPLRALWERKIFPRTGSMVVKKKCFEKVGYFAAGISLWEDLEFVLRLVNHFNVVYTPCVLFNYRNEFSALSINNVPISNEFSFYARPKNKSFFESLILVNNMYQSLLWRIKTRDQLGVRYLFKGVVSNFQYFIISFFYRKTLNLFYKIRPKKYLFYMVSLHEIESFAS